MSNAPNVLNIIGPSYTSRSTFNNNKQLVNWYLEAGSQEGRYPMILMPTPGLTKFISVPGAVKVRGLHNYNGTCYGVAGNKFFKVTSAGVYTKLANLNTSTGAISIASIQDQIMIVDGTNGYIWKITAATWTVISDANYPNTATVVTSMNGRFIVNKNTDDFFYYSKLRDGTNWTTGSSFYRAESYPDNLVAAHYAGSVILLMGQFTTEIWSADTSGTTNVLTALPGMYIDYGCAAASSVAQVANNVFWLTQNRYGQGEVLQIIDFATNIISTPAVTHEISQYSTLSDAFGYIFQEKGHVFYRLTFPTANVTWDYDMTTQMWNKVSSYAAGVDGRHLSNCYTYCYGKHLVGDFNSGNIYEMTSDVYTDNGARIRRLWRFPFIQNTGNKRTTVYNFQLDMELGVGLSEGQGADPKVMFRFSKDGGHTFFSERRRSPNKLGEYYKRAFWPVAGSGYLPYGEIVCTDPIPWMILGATANVQPEFKEG